MVAVVKAAVNLMETGPETAAAKFAGRELLDPAVLAACQQGDHQAFTQLAETYQDRIYSIALRFSGNSATAKDIAQEVFLKLLSQICSFRGEASFDSWLYRLVVNCCLDHQRRNWRWAPVLEDFVERFAARTAANRSALENLLRGEIETQVGAAVAKLPAELRVVVILRYTEGLSYDAIAQIIGCPPGTVASRLNRAHKLLERRLTANRKYAGRE